MSDEKTERDPPLVEIVMREDGPEPVSPAGRLRRALGLGFFGAVLALGLVTFGGLSFLPWYSAPSADDVQDEVCRQKVEQHMGEALGDLVVAQTGAAGAGFFGLAVVGLLLRRKSA